MTCPPKYSIQSYEIPPNLVSELSVLSEKKSTAALLVNWLFLILFISTVQLFIPTQYFGWVYIPAVFIMASRYGVFLQLIHEGSHGLLSRSKSVNHFIATYLCSLPLGIQFDGYTRGHIRHHAFTNTEKDPKSDTEKYRIVNFRDPKLYLLFLKDLLGITALSIFFEYDEYDNAAEKAQGTNGLGKKLGKILQLCFVQLIILGLLFQFSISHYILLWLIPAISPHMFLMRIRGIAEHGLARQLGITKFEDGAVGVFYTRSFLTKQNSYSFRPIIWLEKLLIGSLSVHYHHEHHLLPYVPYYNLKKLHLAISDQVSVNNPDIYAKGYFSAALRSLTMGNSNRLSILDSPSI